MGSEETNRFGTDKATPNFTPPCSAAGSPKQKPVHDSASDRSLADTGQPKQNGGSDGGGFSLSSFNYRQNCLLYFPQHPPQQRHENYYHQLAKEVAALIKAAHGHALVLFTSYAAMSAVKDRLAALIDYPLFTMSRNAIHTLEQFRRTPGSVLLATGSAWEGFDFPGDGVSLLIIPRLPFPRPDAMKEKEREHYPSLRAYIRSVVIPEMQIKLKQGFGRAIRTETDTCVVAILDDRAAPGCRYFGAAKTALPDMRLTSSTSDVASFIRSVKTSVYFQEGRS